MRPPGHKETTSVHKGSGHRTLYAGEPPSRPFSCQPMPLSRCAPPSPTCSDKHPPLFPGPSPFLMDQGRPCSSPSLPAPGHPGLWLPGSSVPCPHHYPRFLLPQGFPLPPAAAEAPRPGFSSTPSLKCHMSSWDCLPCLTAGGRKAEPASRLVTVSSPKAG